ncbi:hypothetical protein B0T22DRAFT_256405 [Podospora appendiculata]|uniref:Uncharacterized protein n=1 Tax=Podospora appendiculata TaxID=314037 RepID=A0AAE0X2L3_9PEZI|nr:hypothetical protein B0T22DRAFT_256405 [Podospora appendiculata]
MAVATAEPKRKRMGGLALEAITRLQPGVLPDNRNTETRAGLGIPVTSRLQAPHLPHLVLNSLDALSPSLSASNHQNIQIRSFDFSQSPPRLVSVSCLSNSRNPARDAADCRYHPRDTQPERASLAADAPCQLAKSFALRRAPTHAWRLLHSSPIQFSERNVFMDRSSGLDHRNVWQLRPCIGTCPGFAARCGAMGPSPVGRIGSELNPKYTFGHQVLRSQSFELPSKPASLDVTSHAAEKWTWPIGR